MTRIRDQSGVVLAAEHDYSITQPHRDITHGRTKVKGMPTHPQSLIYPWRKGSFKKRERKIQLRDVKCTV